MATDDIEPVDKNLLADQRRSSATSTSGRIAPEQRVLGLFTEALIEEPVTVRGLRRVLGDNHPDTLRAINNLAAIAVLAGEPGKALEVQHANKNRR